MGRIPLQRLLLELELEDLFDELLELLFDERRVGWSGVRPTARAARLMPFSQPLKKPCTAVSPRGLLRLLFELLLLDELLLLLLEALLDELELLLLEEFELEFDDEFDDEFELELDEEFELELDEEFDPRPKPPPPKPPPEEALLPPRDPPELPLELLFELLLPALMFNGFTPASTPCAACAISFTSGRFWPCALWLPTTLATAVTMAPMLFFMKHLLTVWLEKPGRQ